MEKSKYYTPDISDICVGYECEVHMEHIHFLDGKVVSQNKEWEKTVVTLDALLEGNRIKNSPFEVNNLRTPYLTIDDINNQGFPKKSTNGINTWFELPAWEINWNDHVQDYYQYKPYHFQITYAPHDNRMKICIDFTGDKSYDTMFEGEVKSINEFRKLLRQLKIQL